MMVGNFSSFGLSGCWMKLLVFWCFYSVFVSVVSFELLGLMIVILKLLLEVLLCWCFFLR